VPITISRSGYPYGISHTARLPALSAMGERKFNKSNGVDDLVLLEEVTADSIVGNLRVRFTKDLIYSYIGPVLVRACVRTRRDLAVRPVLTVLFWPFSSSSLLNLHLLLIFFSL